jgi:hypothetical protein
MIIKFECQHSDNTLEVEQIAPKELQFRIYEDENEITLTLNENRLYSLIGQLLRMQSEMKKEVQNGN